MKLRRAMALAAATAVIAPATFLAAPAAFATESPTPTPTASEPAAPSTSESPSAPETPSSPATTPSAETSTSSSPATTPSAPASSPATTPSPSTSVSPTDPVDECDSFSDNNKVVTELRGLPSKVVAGSGWVNFTYRVTNKSKKDFNAVEAYVDLLAIDGEKFEDSSRFLTLQWQIGGEWKAISIEDGYFGTTGKLKPGEYADAKLRLMVDAKAPAGFGAAFTTGVHIDGKGGCEFGETMIFEFDILAAGTKPGDVDDAEGKPGDKPGNKPAPQGDLEELPVSGNLAETGSSSILPTVGIAGGIAVVAGAGVVFAMKRRRSGDATA